MKPVTICSCEGRGPHVHIPKTTPGGQLVGAVFDEPATPPPVHDPDQGVIVGAGRVDILKRVAVLWGGDWSGAEFDGKDGRDWISTALHGDAVELRRVDRELAEIEAR